MTPPFVLLSARQILGFAAGTHALLIHTEWDAFKGFDYVQIFEEMQKLGFIFDDRNVLDLDFLRRIGFSAEGIGC